jgi:orotidine-5'-phosphate decarboxylase
MALDRLIDGIIKTKNPTVMGLDPKLDYIPDKIKNAAFERYGKTPKGAAAAFFEFNKELIDAIYDIVPAVKPQAACYEALGYQGVKSLAKTISYAQSKGLFVIADGKRNDIGTSMAAYADAWLGVTEIGGETFVPFGADALTVNGYLSSDGIMPLIKPCKEFDKGIFVLCKTSNPSSGEVQDVVSRDGKTVFEAIASLCDRWGEHLPGKYGYTGVGAVVGATYPEQLALLRRNHPKLFFLVPGYGAQGGGVETVKAAFDGDGLGAVVNASRSLICAWQTSQGKSLARATRDEAIRMRDDLSRL